MRVFSFLFLCLAWGGLYFCDLPPVSANEGTISAMLYSPIPNERTISIEILDISDENVLIKQKFEEIFANRGEKIIKNGNLILTIQRAGTIGSWTDGNFNPVIQLRNGEDHTGTEPPEVRVTLFDSVRGGLFNKGKSPGIMQVAASRYQLNISLNHRENGRRLWQGWASANIGKNDNEELLFSMIPVLIDSVGKTVNSQNFSID